jgi:hypothetical protein
MALRDASATERYLEVERGLRGKQCLQRFLSDEAYDQQSDAGAWSASGPGGVHSARLNSVRVAGAR